MLHAKNVLKPVIFYTRNAFDRDGFKLRIDWTQTEPGRKIVIIFSSPVRWPSSIMCWFMLSTYLTPKNIYLHLWPLKLAFSSIINLSVSLCDFAFCFFPFLMWHKCYRYVVELNPSVNMIFNSNYKEYKNFDKGELSFDIFLSV